MKENSNILHNDILKINERNCIIFDLDDTLYSEKEYVESGFKEIAKVYGNDSLFNKLMYLYNINSNNVFQRAGFSQEKCKKCIEIYRNHTPKISLDYHVKATLEYLKIKNYKLGIITDGRPKSQWNKIKALELNKYMDCIIVTDELGGEEYRKPNSKAYEIMKIELNCKFEEMIYVGDNPCKDFYVKDKYPILTIRLLSNGLYADKEYYHGIKEDLCISSISEIMELINV